MNESFDAFLSYSHEDRFIVEQISRRLRTYRPPRRSGLRRRLTVFRDVERLTAAPSLGRHLSDQVRAARHLVLFASPDAAASEYVNHEVQSFLAHGDAQRLLIVLLRGEMAEALPPALAGLEEEPLYIDLRDADRRTFRLETLRLIAALYAVDYSTLRREDEARRFRQRMAGAAAGVASVLLSTSAYLVIVTPAEAWQLVRQPVTRTWSNALAPVTEVAISRSDPETVVWFARNARHARDLDSASSSWTLTIFEAFRETKDFVERAAEAAAAMPGTALAELRLNVPDWQGDEVLDLETTLFAVVDEGTPRFVTESVLRPAEGAAVQVPLSETSPRLWLSVLDYEPAQSLRQLGFSGRDLTGFWIDHTRGGAEQEVHYVGDMSDVAMEVLDAVSAPEYLIFSNDPGLETQLDARQVNEAAEDIWRAEFVDSEAWSVPTEPECESVRFDRDEVEAGRSGRFEGSALKRSLLLALVPLGEDMPEGDFYSIAICQRPGASVAVVKAFWDSHEVVQQPAPLSLVRIGDEAWRPVKLPSNIDRAVATDVRVLPGSSPELTLETDRAGLFRSVDGGTTWQAINHGEAALTQAEDLRLVVTPGPVIHVLGILSRQPGAATNPLYRLERRGVLARWRIGLATLLLGGEVGERLRPEIARTAQGR
ncbi:MAG: TIR domain-containing protein [Gammaproteobacteria bacterium]|nr:TIR domain-containing protein [Gammaproteobacteria bacterium]NIR84569.1 TIR domain-containing protein [Gammaproteobacteria bacterium]NIR90472.1 TIR domain-containing protein [Gammaproteobacteria bacterium]NIU05620.1 TIR domain-containing protein [Gammaproteobacteria bacterium]NIV52759.1 TIR domain-containing protein [Gammaproteobacteria bacterium]